MVFKLLGIIKITLRPRQLLYRQLLAPNGPESFLSYTVMPLLLLFMVEAEVLAFALLPRTDTGELHILCAFPWQLTLALLPRTESGINVSETT